VTISPVVISSAFSRVSVMFDPIKQQHSGRHISFAPLMMMMMMMMMIVEVVIVVVAVGMHL